MSEGPQFEEITLMCCVRFICLEFLRGNIDTPISHLLSGLDIMAVWRARNCKLLHDEALSITSEPHSIPDNLVQMFSRLTIQSMLCGRDPLTGSSDVLEADLSALTPVMFSSLQAARTSLDFLMRYHFGFSANRTNETYNYNRRPNTDTIP